MIRSFFIINVVVFLKKMCPTREIIKFENLFSSDSHRTKVWNKFCRKLGTPAKLHRSRLWGPTLAATLCGAIHCCFWFFLEHWCSYNRPYWNWGGKDDHTTLQNKILVTQIFFVLFFVKKIWWGFNSSSKIKKSAWGHLSVQNLEGAPRLVWF